MGAGRSRCCRTGSYEVLDVSHGEAENFLRASGLQNPDAKAVVESVGGRLMSLVATCESLQQGATIPGQSPTVLHMSSYYDACDRLGRFGASGTGR